MNIDITKLKSGIVNQIEIDELYSFNEEQLQNTEIISLNNVEIKGYISSNKLDSYDINLNIKGVMVLPCSITLEPTNYEFKCQIDGNIDDLLEEIGEVSKKTQNTIDILPIIWENILMEIPMRVVSPEVKDKEISLSGDGWSFTTSNCENNSSPLSELLNYFDDSEVK